MTKIITKKIQNGGGPEFTLPTTNISSNSYISVNSSGQLGFSTKSTANSAIDVASETSLPYLFCISTGYTSGSISSTGWSSELGQWYSDNATYASYMLGIVSGRTSWGLSNGPNYSNYVIPPKINFIQGSRGQSGFMRHFTRYASTTNKYNYPDKMLSAYFIKNSSSSDISSTMYFHGSSYWSSGYEGARAFTLIPNATNANKSSISSLSVSNLWNYSTSSAKFTTSASVTFPANKTICFMIYSSAHYYAGPDNYHFKLSNGIYDFVTSVLSNSMLSIDVDRTLKAINNPNRSSATYEIWN